VAAVTAAAAVIQRLHLAAVVEQGSRARGQQQQQQPRFLIAAVGKGLGTKLAVAARRGLRISKERQQLLLRVGRTAVGTRS
jgi:hypothetical protein